MNLFGTQDPQGASLSIDFEINLPLMGIDRRIGGVAVIDERGRIIVAHRGQIRGRVGIGAKLFRSQFDGDRLTVWDGDRETEVAAITELGSPRFVRQIRFFVEEVKRIKTLSADRGEDESGEDSAPQPLDDEFTGTKTYKINRKVNAVCDHGLIVKTLRELLEADGYRIGKDVYRDLYVHRKKRATSLFEIKPSWDRQSIYTAVGQLLLNAASWSPSPRLFLVVPDDLGPTLANKLQRIGIEVLGFRWENEKPVFPEFGNWRF